MAKKDRSKSFTDKPKVTPRVRKDSFATNLLGSLFVDAGTDVISYIIMDVLVPAAKDTIRDIVTQGIEMMLFGQTSGRNSRRSSPGDNKRSRGGGTIVSYGNYYRDNEDSRGQHRGGRQRSRKEVARNPSQLGRLSSVIFDFRDEASEVLDFLIDVRDEYSQVSLADFYDVVGLSGYSEYTDNLWGWRDNLGEAHISEVKDGFIVDFPEPSRLE